MASRLWILIGRCSASLTFDSALHRQENRHGAKETAKINKRRQKIGRKANEITCFPVELLMFLTVFIPESL